MSRHEEEEAAEPQAAKFSRYRSKRGQSVSNNERKEIVGINSEGPPCGTSGEDPSVSTTSTTASSISRSMSRYRRRANTVSADNDSNSNIITAPPSAAHPIPPVPPIPPMLKSHIDQQDQIYSQEESDGTPTIPRGTSSPPQRYKQLRHTERTITNLNNTADHQSQPSTSSDESQRKRIMSDPDQRERRSREEEDEVTRHAGPIAHQEKETLKQPKIRDLESLQVQLANNLQQTAQSPKPRSPVVEKFVNLARRKKSKDGLSPTFPSAGFIAGFGDKHSRTHLPEVPKLPIGIEAGGKGIVPQIDAPISAVNTGDRIVSVRCRHHVFILPVNPETTPVDIILETAKNMTYDLEWSPPDCVVLESYGPLGLERRIRRFERIRDVMNSWDRDTHNQLIVSVSDDPKRDRNLEIDSVPEGSEPPKGMQLYMYHSNRPGKWNKRWITLTDSGQILCSKKPNTSPTEKDTLSLCHLSDYDIYTPIESQMRRHLKPPKKLCFAVKSQHKPAMFVNTENYVQYFCTEDPNTAAQFSEKLQAWRSWYLVDRRPAARYGSASETNGNPAQLNTIKQEPKKSVNVAVVDGHRIKVSVDESPYAIGEFEPLIDMRRFDKRLSLFGQDIPPSAPDNATTSKQQSHQKHAAKESKGERALIDSIKSADDGAFTGNGLLGEVYEDRKAAQALTEKETTTSKRFSKDFGQNAFTDGPSLLSQQAEADVDAASKRTGTSWFPSALEHTAKHRDVSDSMSPIASAGIRHVRDGSQSSSRGGAHPPPLPQHGRLHSERRGNPGGNPGGHSHPLASYHPPSGPSAAPAHPNRRQAPKPLVNLAPTINEPPQWARKGHGVHAPEGIHHLVDLISVGNPKGGPAGHLEVPPRNLRRPPNSAPLPRGVPGGSGHRTGGGLNQTRSKNSEVPPFRSAVGVVPPMSLLPGSHEGKGTSGRMRMESPRGREQREHTRHRDQRDHRLRGPDKPRETADYNSVPGRTGTMKVV